MSSSSEDDEVPLSSLKSSAINDSDKSEEEFIDDDDETSENNDEDYVDSNDEDDDEDDNTPISKLKSLNTERNRKKRNAFVASPRKTAKKKQKNKSTTANKKKKKKALSDTTVNSNNALVTPSSELYSKSIKGKLIQQLLCRWWYAITWPDPSSILQSPPKSCDALDGFPGVYVHTSGDEVGKIIDYRDKATCPNFENMASKSSEELKELLLKAIEGQRRQLLETEGKGTKAEKNLHELEKWALKAHVVKADKEALKILKAAGLSL